MPSWGEILEELQAGQGPEGGVPLDWVRRKYITALYAYTQRPIIIYATRWTSPIPGADPSALSVSIGDIQGLMEVMRGVRGDQLDLIIHSPGGSMEGAEAFVRYLRSKFRHIRAIVPHAAMSAATMICMACDEVVMGKHSFLGPIDPQFIMQTPLGPRVIPAQAIVEQFKKAQEEISENPSRLASWVPMLSQYGPDLLVQCDNVSDLSYKLVREWLASHMLQGNKAKATKIASWLKNHLQHKSHSRFLDRTVLRAKGVVVVDLERDAELQDLVLSVFHATNLTFQNTVAAKLIENHLGKLFVVQTVPSQPMGQRSMVISLPNQNQPVPTINQ